MDFNKRLNILKGQIEGIKKMIDEDKDCILVMQQFKAIKNGLNQVSMKYMSKHLKKCIGDETPDTKKIENALNTIFTF